MSEIEKKEQGALVNPVIQEEWNLANKYAKSGMMPKAFNSPEKVFVGIHLCKELKISPIIGLKSMYVLGGVPIMFGDLPLSLVRRSGALESIKEEAYDQDSKLICVRNKNLNAPVYCAVCTVKRKGEQKDEAAFTMDQAKQAGLLSNLNYKKYPNDMLRARARSRALKTNFADVLMGFSIGEYDYAARSPQEMEQTTIETTATVTNDINSLGENNANN